MARQTKRLHNRTARLSLDQRMRRDPKAWEEELASWRAIGVDTRVLLTLLEGARVERYQYEGQLEARADSLTKWKIGRAESARKKAGPLIHLLKTEWALDGPPDLFFGDLGEQVESAVQRYIETLGPPPAARGAPGDPWLRKTALVLARVLRARRQPWRRTVQAIERLLKLAGHGNIATVEKIRHYVRAERRRNPKFGVELPAGLGAWFAKSDWRPRPSELGESRRKRRSGS